MIRKKNLNVILLVKALLLFSQLSTFVDIVCYLMVYAFTKCSS